MAPQTPPDDDNTPAKPGEVPQAVETNEKIQELPEAQRKMVWGVREVDRPILVEWQEDNTPGRRWILETDDVTIGRDEPSDLVIRMDQISRRHLRIYRNGDHYFVADLDSKNETWVNGERVTNDARVKDGDEINVALVVKLIFLGEDAQPHQPDVE